MSSLENSTVDAAHTFVPPKRNRIRWEFGAALCLGLLQSVLTSLWAEQFTLDLQWVGGAVIEFALTTYFAVCLLNLQRRFRIGLPVVAVGLLLPPVIGMAKYQYLMDPAGFGDLFELRTLVLHYGFYGWVGAAFVAVFIGGFGLIFLRNLSKPTYHSGVVWLPALGFWCIVIAKLSLPAAWTSGLPSMPTLRYDHVVMPAPIVFGNWGGFLRSVMVYADRVSIVARLRDAAEPDFGFLGKVVEAPEKRNVYFIVLESFMDPQAIAGTTYSMEPLSPLFQRWRAAGGLIAMSPVFGGRSAEAEFEAYCGLPVTFEGGPVVFPQLHPAAIDCLPRKLARLGWRTEARTIADPRIYNYGATYPKIGFQNLYFADSVVTDDTDGLNVPSAEAVLSTHLQHVDQLLSDGKPFFTSVFGTFGHFPYALDVTKRPYVVAMNTKSADLITYVNNVHYTSEAVARYVDHVFAKDPNALVVAFGDHHPILRDTEAPIDYPGLRAGRQDMPLLIMDGPRGLIPLQGRVSLYDVPEIVSDILTGGRFCKANSCAFLQERALRPLPEALFSSDRKTARTVDCRSAGDDSLCRGAVHQVARYQAALATLLGDE